MTSTRTRSGLAVSSVLLAFVWSLGAAPAAWSSNLDTATPTPTPTETETPTPTATETPSPTPTATETETPTSTETETPMATLSATPTPAVVTATPTPEPLNHFLCYESHQKPVNRRGVHLRDQFDGEGSSTVTVQRAKRLCAPADKAGEDPTAPHDPAHLSAYTIHQTSPQFERRGPIPVAPDNPILFPMTVTLTRPSRLMVPAAKALGTTPPSALAAPIDHYKCYRVKGARTRLPGVSVETQFGPVTVDIKKPIELCTPVDKNGEGIIDDVHHLLCYQVRTVAQTQQTVSTTNQFEKPTFDIFGIRELCVPAFKFPGFCGDGEFNAPGEQCDGSTAGCPANPNETCSANCTCQCQPLTQCPAGSCGSIDDGCGGTIDCGGCTFPQVCGGAGTPNQCELPPVCSASGASTAFCTCSDGFQCSAQCFSNQTCAQRRQACVDFCGVGVSGDCAAAPCFDCVTGLRCEEPTCGDGVVNQQTEECDGSDDGNCPQACQADCTCPAQCVALQGDCTAVDQCCDADQCADNFCGPSLSSCCQSLRSSCSDSCDCCGRSSICSGGACCNLVGGACSQASDCCAFNDGGCENGACCVGIGAGCIVDSHCCAGATCNQTTFVCE